MGRVSILYGPPRSFKTSLALAAVKTFTSRGGVAYYVDTELKTAYELVAPAVYVEAADLGHLFDALLDVLKKVRYINPLLVVVDSITAAMHHLTLNHPDYAKEKMRSLAHIVCQLTTEMVTVLFISWQNPRGGFHGKYLNPSLVVRTEKRADGLRAVVEYDECAITPIEDIVPVEEVLKVALA